MFKVEVGLNKETLEAVNRLADAIAGPQIEIKAPAISFPEAAAKVQEPAAKPVDKPAEETKPQVDEEQAKRDAANARRRERAAEKRAQAQAEKEAAEKAEAEQAEAAAPKKSDDAAAKAETQAAEQETTETEDGKVPEPKDTTVAPTVGVSQIRACLVAFGECYGKDKVVDVLKTKFNKTQLGQLDKAQFGELYLALDAETEVLGDEGIDPANYEALLEALDDCGAA